jgi:hypothetical protein
MLALQLIDCCLLQVTVDRQAHVVGFMLQRRDSRVFGLVTMVRSPWRTA